MWADFSDLKKRTQKSFSHLNMVDRLLRDILLIASALLCSQCAPPTAASAPNPSARAANQLCIAGNACGPTAIVNSFRFGSDSWQKVAASIDGKNDQAILRHIIVKHGGTWSSSIPSRYRWSRRGINASDLTDLANEIAQPFSQPRLQLHIPRQSRSSVNLLTSSYAKLSHSLQRGFPPTVGLRRYDQGNPIDSHFVTIIAVADLLEKPTPQFSIRYVDPLGGKIYFGVIRVNDESDKTRPGLIADLPHTPVGKSKSSRDSYLTLDAMIVLP
jgi:hypothetical protein